MFEDTLEMMQQIAHAMNKAGTVVDSTLFRGDSTHWTESLHEGVVYGRWSVSESDLFWRCSGPDLMRMPSALQAGVLGHRVYLYQPYLYLAAQEGGCQEWIEEYGRGSDLVLLAASKLKMEYPEAKTALYRYLYGAIDCASTWQVEATFPWLAGLVERFENRTDDVFTAFGTRLNDSLFYRSGLGRFLTQTVKDVTRLGIIHLFVEQGITPNLILPDCAIIPSHHEDLTDIWGRCYGFQVKTRDRFGNR